MRKIKFYEVKVLIYIETFVQAWPMDGNNSFLYPPTAPSHKPSMPVLLPELKLFPPL